MKKLFILALCLSFAACGNDNQTENNDESMMSTEQTGTEETEIDNTRVDADTTGGFESTDAGETTAQ